MTRRRRHQLQLPIEPKPKPESIPSNPSNVKQPGFQPGKPNSHATRPTSPNQQIMTRVWSKCDVIVIMKGMVDFIAQMGSDPMNNLDDFLHFINNNNNSLKCSEYKFDKITWKLQKNGDCENNSVLHLKARNCNVGNDCILNSKDVGRKNEGSVIVLDQKKSISGTSCSGTNSSGIDCFKVGNSVGEKKMLILGKCEGGVSGSSLTNEAKTRRRGRRRAGEKKSSLGKNEGGISCSSSVSSVGDKKSILEPYVGGVSCSGVLNNVKKSSASEDMSSLGKNEGGISCCSSVSSVGEKQSILGEFNGGSSVSRRARKNSSVGEEKVDCVENVVGISCMSSLENREKKSIAGAKNWKIKSKIYNGGEKSKSISMLDDGEEKSKSVMDDGGKKVDITQENVSRRQKKKNSSVSEKMTSCIDNVGGVTCTGTPENMDKKMGNGGEKSTKTQGNMNKNKSGSVCVKKSKTRVRARRKTTIVMVGKKATLKNKEDADEKISILEAKKGGMKNNTDVKLTSFGFRDQTGALLMKKSNVSMEYGAGKCTKTQKNMKNKISGIGVTKLKPKSNIRSKTMAIIHVGKKAILKARKDGGTKQYIKNNTCGKNPFLEAKKSEKKNNLGFRNDSDVMPREALRRMISRRLSLRDELETDISWCSPEIGVYKWNTDASFREDDRMAAIGGVLRDWQGSFRCVFSCPVDSCDINEAELRAIYKALELASHKNWLLSLNMVIESDSMNAVTWCNEDNGGPLNLGYMLSFIRECRRWWPGLEITYMSRKSNSVADRLAKQGHQRCSDFVTWM